MSALAHCPYHPDRPADAAWGGTCCRGCEERAEEHDAAELARIRERCPEVAQADCTVCGEPTCVDPAACEAWPDAPDCREQCEYATCRSCTERDDAEVRERRMREEARWPLP